MLQNIFQSSIQLRLSWGVFILGRTPVKSSYFIQFGFIPIKTCLKFWVSPCIKKWMRTHMFIQQPSRSLPYSFYLQSFLKILSEFIFCFILRAPECTFNLLLSLKCHPSCYWILSKDIQLVLHADNLQFCFSYLKLSPLYLKLYIFFL